MLFIKEKNNEDAPIIVFDNDVFEMKPISDLYGQYGQQIGYCDSGAWIELTDKQAAWLNDELETEQYIEGTIINAYDDYETFESIVDKFGDDCVNDEEVLAYTYWNGHNFKSIIINNGDNWDTHETVSDELASELFEIINSDDFCLEKAGPYQQEYRSEKWLFIESNFQGHPEFCMIVENEEV